MVEWLRLHAPNAGGSASGWGTKILYATGLNMYLLDYGTHEASLVAQMVRNLPVMQETQVQSLHWKDPLEKGMATKSRALKFNKSLSKWSEKQYSGVIDSIFSDSVVYSQILEVN